MANIVIYYQLEDYDSLDEAILIIQNLIHDLEPYNKIVNVTIEETTQNNRFLELVSSPLDKIDFLYTNKHFNDEFNNKLIHQLSQTENFYIKYFY